MLDTCVFNFLKDGQYFIKDLPTGKYFITHVQRDELQATTDPTRRCELLKQLSVVGPENLPTSVAITGLSRTGEASSGDDSDYLRILAELDKRKKKKNNYKDAVIGSTAMQNKFHLITGDSDFAEVMKSVWDASMITYWRK